MALLHGQTAAAVLLVHSSGIPGIQPLTPERTDLFELYDSEGLPVPPVCPCLACAPCQLVLVTAYVVLLSWMVADARRKST